MTSVDGTVRFFTQVNALLHPGMTVLDFGAGRGWWLEDDVCSYRQRLMNLKGKVARVIACDIDPAVLNNGSADEAFVIERGGKVPVADQSVDLILSDNTFEHVQDPAAMAAEFKRLLKPGGWICARTPNKYAYTSLPTMAVPNRLHALLLKRAQPDRKAEDVFPTAFKLNTLRDVARHFPPAQFDNYSYRALPEPGYHFNKKPLLAALLLMNKVLPHVLTAPLYVFLRRR